MHENVRFQISPNEVKLILMAPRGSVSVSPREPYVCMHDLNGSFITYSLMTRRALHKMPHEQGENVQLPSLFIHDGRAVALGSAVGEICLWDVNRGQRFQTLIAESG